MKRFLLIFASFLCVTLAINYYFEPIVANYHRSYLAVKQSKITAARLDSLRETTTTRNMLMDLALGNPKAPEALNQLKEYLHQRHPETAKYLNQLPADPDSLIGLLRTNLDLAESLAPFKRLDFNELQQFAVENDTAMLQLSKLLLETKRLPKSLAKIDQSIRTSLEAKLQITNELLAIRKLSKAPVINQQHKHERALLCLLFSLCATIFVTSFRTNRRLRMEPNTCNRRCFNVIE